LDQTPVEGAHDVDDADPGTTRSTGTAHHADASDSTSASAPGRRSAFARFARSTLSRAVATRPAGVHPIVRATRSAPTDTASTRAGSADHATTGSARARCAAAARSAHAAGTAPGRTRFAGSASFASAFAFAAPDDERRERADGENGSKTHRHIGRTAVTSVNHHSPE
jgi:hypothetical protein